MSNSNELPPEAENSTREQTEDDDTTCCKRKKPKKKWQRRNVMALMLLVLPTIPLSRWSTILTLVDSPALDNWRTEELARLYIYVYIGYIFWNILGALLIYQYSNYKFLLISVTASSILHMLTPMAGKHHSIVFLYIVVKGQDFLLGSICIAGISVWKDWAPPAERIKLVTISICGMYLGLSVKIVTNSFEIFQYNNSFIGIAGLIWVYLWYSIMSDTPQNDPLISEKEFRYLESTIPPHYQEKVKLKDAPWKSILKSKQVKILCLIFLKLAFSSSTLQLSGVFYNYKSLGLLYAFFFVIILIVTAFVIGCLLRKVKDRTLTTRRIFLCTGFCLQSIFLLGAIFSHSEFVKVILYVCGYSILALSIPVALTYPLDLSPRYVSILTGIGFLIFNLESLSAWLLFQHFPSFMMGVESRMFIIDGVISLCIAIIYGVWGNAEEQRWSLLPPSHRRTHRRYSTLDDDVELNHVTENL